MARPPVTAKPPTETTVLEAMEEFRDVGIDEFLKRYAHGRKPFSLYIRHDGVDYPFKALWAAAHRPRITATDFGYRSAIKPLERMGFGHRIHLRRRKAIVTPEDATEFVSDLLEEAFLEGGRYISEVELIRRSSALIAKAKEFYAPVCVACGFDFGKVYGEHGEGYIECHHLDPVSKRGKQEEITRIEDVAMLCANCHRMVHYGPELLDINALKKIIASNQPK